MTTTTTEDEAPKGPSKGELKKLAKKAEKAAKKAGIGGGAAGNTAPQPQPQPTKEVAVAVVHLEAATTTTTTATSTTTTSAGGWSIVNPDAGNAATIKAVWTAQACGVELNGLKEDDTQPTALVVSDSNNHSFRITGGGNAMAMAFAGSSNSRKSLQFTEQCWTEEWCEWERTTLRTATDTKTTLTAALQHMEHALTHHSPCHLVGTSWTVADICVATTLMAVILNKEDAASSIVNVPVAVQRFLKAHEPAYHAAVAKAVQLQEQAAATTASSKSMSAPIDMNEPSLLMVVDTVFRDVVRSVFGPDIVLPKSVVKLCQNSKHGDFQLSAAMPIFAAIPKKGPYQTPQQVAAALIEAVGANHPVITDLQIQGPGFVLCRLQAAYLQNHVNIFLKTNKLAMPVAMKKQTCVVDFSSPNIAKEMHVGHLRSTIIGEAVCRILEAAGHTVHRVNHVGDWGTQFGMLIQYLKEEYPAVVADNDDELPNITDLTSFYKNAKQRFDENAEFKKTSQTNVVKLQSGDAECLKIWKMLCDVSRQEFQKVYTRLDVTCEEYGESYYNAKIPAIIDEFVAADKIKIEEGGAKCVFVDKYKVPLMLQKSDGGYGYDSTDMAALRYRLKDLQADRVIVITDFSQGDHFKMVYAAGHDIGWVNAGQRLEHIGFGTVQGEDGKRFKTRSGDTVRLVDLLDEAVNRMEAELRQRIEEGKANITLDELHPVAEAIGYGAVKYYDLRRNPTSNYKFSYDQMLDTKGDTAVYLLYARVRLESIAAKAAAEHNVVVDDLLKAGETIQITHPSERNLALQLQLFTDTMEQTLDDLYPYHICEYVYKLATAASDFVTQCRVLGSPEMKSRVLLCHATTSAMHQCFDLLGIRHVKRI